MLVSVWDVLDCVVVREVSVETVEVCVLEETVVTIVFVDVVCDVVEVKLVDKDVVVVVEKHSRVPARQVISAKLS